MIDPTWPQVAVIVGVAGTVAAALVKVFVSFARPDAAESSSRRENKADVIAEATVRLTGEVKSLNGEVEYLRRDVESLKEMQLKLIDLTVKGLSKI